MRLIIMLLVGVAAITAAAQSPSAGLTHLPGATPLASASAAVRTRVTAIPATCAGSPASRLCAIHWHRRRADHYRARMGLAPIPYSWLAERYPARRLRILRYWVHVQHAAALRLNAYLASPWMPGHPWHADAICVHNHEASWTNPSGIGPEVSGGMQIGIREWGEFGGRAYAPAAYLATPDEQLHVAYNYWRVSGWHPWPATASLCGLL